MPSYASPSDIVAILPGLPQVGEGGSSDTVALIDQHNRRAFALINGKLAKRYEVPFGGGTHTALDIPPQIRQIAEEYVSFWTYRSSFPKDSVVINEWTETLKEGAVADLEMLRNAEIDLVDVNGALITERGAASKIDTTTIDFKPTFDESNPLDWQIDPDKLDQLDGERQ